MKFDMSNMVKHCSFYQQAKPDRASYPGLLQLLPIRASAWEVVFMDFVEGLPTIRFN
jgi:hypothetical protein